MMKARGPTVAKMLQGEDTPVTFDLAGCIKDLQSMQAEGKARGLSLPLVQMTLACMEESASRGSRRQGSRDAFGVLVRRK